MPEFEKIHPVNHAAADMFDLVADVEHYPEFVPLCTALHIKSRREKKGRELLICEMSVGYKSIAETFTCQVMLNRADLEINVQYVDGPFRHLNNRWHFVETSPQGCDVHFHINYEFRSKMLGMVMGSMFDKAFKHFTTAFEQRADALYA